MLNEMPPPNEVSLLYSYTPAADLKHNGKIGETKIEHVAFEYRLMTPVTTQLRLIAGIEASETYLEDTGAGPLPDRLRMAGVSVGAVQDLANVFGPGWSGTVMVRPSLTSDTATLSTRHANVPGAVSLGYRRSADLSFDFGVLVSPHGEYTVLPLLGARWNFAPQWTASVGFPQTGVAYKARPDLMLRAGVSLQGGTYRVSHARLPQLNNTWLSYREFRLGVGGDYEIVKNLLVSLDAGVVANRRFDYFDRDYKVDGSSTPYVSVRVRARF